MRGPRDRNLVERLVKEGKPDDFKEAMLMVQDYESDEYQLKQTFGGVSSQPRAEPMEVDQMETMAAITPQRVEEKERDTMKELDTLKRQMSGLTKQFT